MMLKSIVAKRSTILRAGLLFASALLLAPASTEAQQPSPARDTSGGAPPLTPAETAACSKIIGYAFQNPPVLQQFERYRASGQSKILQNLPDSVRPQLASAIAKGQGDTLKAIARRQLGAKTAPTFDEMIGFVIAFPDSIRGAVATLMASGRPISCT